MTQFYLPELNLHDVSVEITGTEFRHIVKSCRHREGDIIQIFNGQGIVVKAKIQNVFNDKIKTTIIEKRVVEQYRQKIVLYQGIIKIDRFEFVIEKTTELGVDTIVPVLLERSSVEKNKFEKKIGRFKQIVIEAAKQSHRAYLPNLEPVRELKEICLLQKEEQFLNIILCKSGTESFSKIIDRIKNSTIIRIFVGPEGDFTEKELSLFSTAKNVFFVNLGSNILRSETAAILATGIVNQIREGLV